MSSSQHLILPTSADNYLIHIALKSTLILTHNKLKLFLKPFKIPESIHRYVRK